MHYYLAVEVSPCCFTLAQEENNYYQKRAITRVSPTVPSPLGAAGQDRAGFCPLALNHSIPTHFSKGEQRQGPGPPGLCLVPTAVVGSLCLGVQGEQQLGSRGS